MIELKTAGLYSSRNEAIDAAKGYLIIMVVYAHCFTSGILHDYFFSFHMPAFYVLTGVTTALSGEMNKPTMQVIKKMLLRIGIPFLFFETLGTIQFFIRFGFKLNLFGLIFNALIMQCNNIVDWFLYALFFAKLICRFFYLLFNKICRHDIANHVYLLLSLALLLASIFVPYPKLTVVGIIRTILIAHGFIAIGFILAPVVLTKKPAWGVIFLILALILSMFNSECPDIYQLKFGYPVIFLFAALFGSYGILQFSEIFAFSAVRWLGNNSLIIMGTHIPILLLARFTAHTLYPTFWIRVVDFTLIFLLEVPIIYLLRKKAPILIGRKMTRA